MKSEKKMLRFKGWRGLAIGLAIAALAPINGMTLPAHAAISEAKCRSCHEDPFIVKNAFPADVHHRFSSTPCTGSNIVTQASWPRDTCEISGGTYQCITCHSLQWDGTQPTMIIDRNCNNCHLRAAVSGATITNGRITITGSGFAEGANSKSVYVTKTVDPLASCPTTVVEWTDQKIVVDAYMYPDQTFCAKPDDIVVVPCVNAEAKLVAKPASSFSEAKCRSCHESPFIVKNAVPADVHHQFPSTSCTGSNIVTQSNWKYDNCALSGNMYQCRTCHGVHQDGSTIIDRNCLSCHLKAAITGATITNGRITITGSGFAETTNSKSVSVTKVADPLAPCPTTVVEWTDQKIVVDAYMYPDQTFCANPNDTVVVHCAIADSLITEGSPASCLGCHEDKSALVNCRNKNWLLHERKLWADKATIEEMELQRLNYLCGASRLNYSGKAKNPARK